MSWWHSLVCLFWGHSWDRERNTSEDYLEKWRVFCSRCGRNL